MDKHLIDGPSAHLALQFDISTLNKAKASFVRELGEAGCANLFKELTQHGLDAMRYASVIPLDGSGENRQLSTSYELVVRGMDPHEASQVFETTASAQSNGTFAERAREIFRRGFAEGNTVVGLVQAHAPKLTAAILNESLRRVLAQGEGGLAFICKSHMPALLVLHKSSLRDLDTIILDDELNLDFAYRLADVPNIEMMEGLGCVEEVADLPIWEEVKRNWTKRASKISVIIPAYNEADNLSLCITQARSYLQRACPGADIEVVVADGGSSDDSLITVGSLNVVVVESERGRAKQMNAGAAAASGDVYVFLHADTLLRPSSKPKDLRNILKDPQTIMGAFTFDFGLHGVKNKNAIGFSRLFSSQLFEMSKRSNAKKGAIPFGDQAYFIRAEVFDALGGFPDYEIMEDYAFAKRCSLLGDIALSPDRAETSLRRSLRYDLFKAIRINDSLAELFDEGASISELERFRRRKLFG